MDGWTQMDSNGREGDGQNNLRPSSSRPLESIRVHLSPLESTRPSSCVFCFFPYYVATSASMAKATPCC